MAVVTALSLRQTAPSKRTFRVELARTGEFLPIGPVIAPKNLHHRASNYNFRHSVCAELSPLFRVLFRLQKARTVGNQNRFCRLLKLGSWQHGSLRLQCFPNRFRNFPGLVRCLLFVVTQPSRGSSCSTEQVFLASAEYPQNATSRHSGFAYSSLPWYIPR